MMPDEARSNSMRKRSLDSSGSKAGCRAGSAEPAGEGAVPLEGTRWVRETVLRMVVFIGTGGGILSRERAWADGRRQPPIHSADGSCHQREEGAAVRGGAR